MSQNRVIISYGQQLDSGGRPWRCIDYPNHIFHDTEDVNLYFAEICRDSNYSVADVECFRKHVLIIL